MLYAVEKGHPRVVKMLVDSGSNIKSQDQQGNTALHLCCEKGDLMSTTTILEFLRCDESTLSEILYVENKAGLKPIDLAMGTKTEEHVKIAELLAEKQRQFDQKQDNLVRVLITDQEKTIERERLAAVQSATSTRELSQPKKVKTKKPMSQ